MILPGAEIVDELTQEGTARTSAVHDHIDMVWQALVRLLDQKDSSFRN